MKISGFTFIHNALSSGYPIVEAIRAVQPYVNEVVVVDMQSTDDTRQILEEMVRNSQFTEKIAGKYIQTEIKIIDGFWGNEAGETLKQAHGQYIKCSGDIILHFEADEVYDDSLLKNIIHLIEQGVTDISVHRLQLEQNFQRCRWYPEPVHRVFGRLSHTAKDGHTTNRHEQATVLGPENGYLWDITNCFRDNWFNRVAKQAQLRNEGETYLMVPVHCTLPPFLTQYQAEKWVMDGRHWEWKTTPFNVPEILKPLVGMTKYEPKL